MMQHFNNTNRKGFSLVELVTVIIIIAILAMATFTVGFTVVSRSKASKTIADLKYFSVATELVLNENPSVAGINRRNNHDSILAELNLNLDKGYQFKEIAIDSSITGPGNIRINSGTDYTWKVYECKKTDAWGTSYYAILDYAERHDAGTADYYITILSAGPDGKSFIGECIGSDDIFLLTQYTNGVAMSQIYDVSANKIRTSYLATDKSLAPDPDSKKYIFLEHSFDTKGADLDIEGDGIWKDREKDKKTATTIQGVDGYLLYCDRFARDSTSYTGACLPVIF